ncbi:MAG TPA: helix-turn-helix domain-containing protein [Micromonosporaceae bacterium]
MASYADYCPIAIGVDVLGDRWTPLIIRELIVGATGFNEIHRGIPKMSRTLLAQRLRQLERRGLIQREASGPGRSGRYALTSSGQALTPIVWAIGHWAAEWIFGDPTEEDCDGLSLMWRLHQYAIPSRLPAERTVVELNLTGAGAARGWLCIEGGEVTVCKDDPGYEVDLAVQAETRQLHRWVIGLAAFRDLLAGGQVHLFGPSRLGRAFPGWFNTSHFAESHRRAEQRRLSKQPALGFDEQRRVLAAIAL